MDRSDVEILARDRVYDGYSAIDAYRLRHRKFGGGWTEPLSRELLERGNAVCVLPYDPVRDEVVLIEQFRIGAYGAGLRPWQLEIVAGIVEDGETEEQVAHRELQEECGCTASSLHHICRGLSSSGVLSEIASIYCAVVDASGAGGVFGIDGEGEDIRAQAYSFDTAMALIADDAFHHTQGVVALYWLAANRGRLRQNT